MDDIFKNMKGIGLKKLKREKRIKTCTIIILALITIFTIGPVLFIDLNEIVILVLLALFLFLGFVTIRIADSKLMQAREPVATYTLTPKVDDTLQISDGMVIFSHDEDAYIGNIPDEIEITTDLNKTAQVEFHVAVNKYKEYYITKMRIHSKEEK